MRESDELCKRVLEALEITAGAGVARLESTPLSHPAVSTWDGVANLATRVAWLTGRTPGFEIPDVPIGDSMRGLGDALGQSVASGFGKLFEGLKALSGGAVPSLSVVRANGRLYFNREAMWDLESGPPSNGNWKSDTFMDGPTEDPLWLLDVLPAATEAVAVGEEPVRGERATRVRVTVDVIEADRLSEHPIRVAHAEVRALHALPAEVWLGESGRISRMQAAPGGSGADRCRVTELYDFGLEVDVKAPESLPAP